MRGPHRIAVIALLAAGIGIVLAAAERGAGGAASPSARDASSPAIASPAGGGRAGVAAHRAFPRHADGRSRAGVREPVAGAVRGAPRDAEAASGQGLAPSVRRAPSALPLPELDEPVVADGSVTAALSGWDPAAPRRITLWRVEDGRHARLAVTRSEPGGRFRFAEVAALGKEVAVGAGDAPPRTSARRIRVPGLPPAPPSVQAFTGSGGGAVLRVWPSASATAVVFAAGGRDIGRRALPLVPSPGGRRVEERVVPGSPATPIYVAEEIAGGARSAWVRVDIGAPDEESAAASFMGR